MPRNFGPIELFPSHPGWLDRHRAPGTLHRCLIMCIPGAQLPVAIHYDGCCGMSTICMLCPWFNLLWFPFCWKPELEKEGDNPGINNGENNRCCAKGCLDRKRKPHAVVQGFTGFIAPSQYDGCGSQWCVISVFALLFLSALPLPILPLLLLLVWQPKIDRDMVGPNGKNPKGQAANMVGAPIMAGQGQQYHGQQYHDYGAAPGQQQQQQQQVPPPFATAPQNQYPIMKQGKQ